MPLDKNGLSIKNVDVRVSHLAMDEQGHVQLLHGFQQRRNPPKVCHTSRRIRGGIGGIELGRRDNPLAMALAEHIR